MQTVEKIVANPVTDGIIVVLDDGNVIAHWFTPFATVGRMAGIATSFAGEVNGTEVLTDYSQSRYDSYSDEVEHPAAVTVYTKEKGWLI